MISLTDEDTKGKILENEGIKVYYLGLRRDALNLAAAILRFRRALKKEKPYVMITYLIHANLFGRIFGKMFGVKKIINSVRNRYEGRWLEQG